MDRQTAIMAIQNNIVRSSIVLTCVKNLNSLGEGNHVAITRKSGHAGISGNEKAGILTKSRSALNSSDGRVAKASVSGAVDLAVIPSGLLDLGLIPSGLLDLGLIPSGLLDLGLIPSGLLDLDLIPSDLLTITIFRYTDTNNSNNWHHRPLDLL